MIKRVIKNWKSSSLFSMPKELFVSNGMSLGRRTIPFLNDDFRLQAFKAFSFENLYDEPVYGNFIGNHYKEGAHTHNHKDSAPDGFMHVRANWMIKKPTLGGNPVIENIELDIDVNDLWICFASEEYHSSTPIGDTERLICSFGALIKKPINFNLKDIIYEPTRR